MLEKLKKWLASEPQPKRHVVVKHRINVVVSADGGEKMTKEDALAFEHELSKVLEDAELNGHDATSTKAAIEELARKHGAQIEEYEDS
ncbi:MAG TPA: hypothetical protein VF091_02885 [Gaiellaceae bacterium]